MNADMPPRGEKQGAALEHTLPNAYVKLML